MGALDELGEAGLLRELRTVSSPAGPRVRVDGHDALLLCSNDYLGLAADARVREAAAEAAQRWGAGAGSSRLVSGALSLHAALEAEVADFKRREACLLVGSGYLANVGVLSALCGPGEVILSDALNHASIVDGCRLARAETLVYAHADLDALADGLRRVAGRPVTIVTDAVFSMDGDLAPLEGIVALAREHGARVIVDEAHATGVVGPAGRGLAASHGADIVIGTFSKALGSYGAFVACDAATRELLVNRMRPVIYSTALPPAVVGAARSALAILGSEPALVRRLHHNARVLREALGAPAGDMPIVPLVIGDPHAAMELSQRALERGVFAQAIRPPTVPEGTSRLRLVARADHSAAELRAAGRTLAELL